MKLHLFALIILAFSLVLVSGEFQFSDSEEEVNSTSVETNNGNPRIGNQISKKSNNIVWPWLVFDDSRWGSPTPTLPALKAAMNNGESDGEDLAALKSALQEVSNDHEQLKRDSLRQIQELRSKYQTMEVKIENQQAKLEVVEKSTVPPVGFIYIQYGSQAEPQALWPTVKWQNVSPDYAGLFFRTEGGNSLGFGEPQDDVMRTLVFKPKSFTELTELNQILRRLALDNAVRKGGEAYFLGNEPTRQLAYSKKGITSVSYATDSHDDEVRPVNQAMRIWKRVQ